MRVDLLCTDSALVVDFLLILLYQARFIMSIPIATGWVYGFSRKACVPGRDDS